MSFHNIDRISPTGKNRHHIFYIIFYPPPSIFYPPPPDMAEFSDESTFQVATTLLRPNYREAAIKLSGIHVDRRLKKGLI